MIQLFCTYILFLFTFSALCQNEDKIFTVKYLSEIPEIDGVLDENVWEQAEEANNFQQYFPSDSILAIQGTSIKMFYDGTTLYVGIKLETSGSNYVIPSLKRDYRAGSNDNISLLFDTFNDGSNAFLFGINPYGVIREALISNGGGDLGGFNTSWDVKWKGESKIFDGYYSAELAIPLTSFKFKEGETKWRFNSYRFDTQDNETSTWARIPQNQLVFGLAFMGDMVFEKPLGKYRTPIAIIPYINAISQKDFETNIAKSNIKVGDKDFPVKVKEDKVVESSIFPSRNSWQEVVVAQNQEVKKKELLAKGVTHIHFDANMWVYLVLVILIGISWGIGKAAVYKHIPDYFPNEVGVVGGMVGLLGGLGGFFGPIIFGYLLTATGFWASSWMFVFVFSVICLIWMHSTVTKMMNEKQQELSKQMERLATK